MSIDPTLEALIEAVGTQTAAIDAILADPTAGLRTASNAMKTAANAALGFNMLGTITSVDFSGESSAQFHYEPWEGAEAVADSMVIVSKDAILGETLDTGTATVTTINDPGVQITVSTSSGWTPVEGHVFGIAT